MASPVDHVRGVIIVFPWLAWVFIVDVLLSALLPFLPFVPDVCYNISSALAESGWAWIQLIFTNANGAVITDSGDALPRGESAIVVANHVGWSDFYMIQALAMRVGMLGRCRYFAKTQLKWVPFLGWGLWALGMPLISRRWDRDQKELDRVFAGIVERRWPTWLVSFSEATRYTPAKYQDSMAWCTEHNRPQPQHLLYPRTKGFVTTVKHLRKAPQVKAVYDLTIAYEKGSKFQIPPSMWETLSVARLSDRKNGKGYRFHVHVRRFPLVELPTKDDELAKWLETRWVEKGIWLEQKRLEWAESQAELK
ncbi:1-acyl-sn-glycerol-3-phosphate acyltransferase [Sporothrix brasiliensis 5110]|uniref:1-acyl-sn-glycerol-3-phosphate acyltransferase n=1 Tax=Sporothrix brasiliensis 5110 TaxID=1398154 RepID=A0A0C2FF80_9PEZI|nr:1-acyl-sn-glycerol-3-phosphate acyltransferase [Sporothrix brasiliensis 5110]KIH89763.1 1-acyl-sn-glycerol-3-phosphate acyltransferase [Sporothrix brasiliensis 5110]